MVFIRHRYNRCGENIKNPEKYIPQYTEDLISFLKEMIVKEVKDFDNNYNKNNG